MIQHSALLPLSYSVIRTSSSCLFAILYFCFLLFLLLFLHFLSLGFPPPVQAVFIHLTSLKATRVASRLVDHRHRASRGHDRRWLTGVTPPVRHNNPAEPSGAPERTWTCVCLPQVISRGDNWNWSVFLRSVSKRKFIRYYLKWWKKKGTRWLYISTMSDLTIAIKLKFPGMSFTCVKANKQTIYIYLYIKKISISKEKEKYLYGAKINKFNHQRWLLVSSFFYMQDKRYMKMYTFSLYMLCLLSLCQW